MGAGCACLYQALSEVISAPFRLERRGLVLRFPLAVSAAMGVFCVCEPDRAAVVDASPTFQMLQVLLILLLQPD